MDVKGTVDFSSYILFEATGDSEADFVDPNLGGYGDEFARVGDDHDHGHGNDHDDDDALSCSYDRSDACNAAEANWGGECCDADDDEEDDGDDVKKEGEEEKDVVYGTSYCDEDDEMLQEEHHKSFVSFDSNQGSVDEREKNRLFWEACLAS